MIILAYTYDWVYKFLFYFHLCMYLSGFPSYIFIHKSFLARGESCMLGVIISWSCMHVIPGYNIECTPEDISHPRDWTTIEC